jgi:exopolysaccharide biosynthesis polyprenyl glycosylphosphotransferase
MTAEPLGFDPVGFVSTSERDLRIRGNGDLSPVVGDLSTLGDAIRQTRAECVFVASSAMRMDDMPRVTRTVRQAGIEFRVTANLPEMLSSRLAPQSFRGLMALALKPVQLTGAQAALKRILDIALAATGVLLLAPFWLLAAILIKATSRGPVLYRQARIGRLGKPFSFLKFRTMVRGADALVTQLDRLNEATGPLFKMRDDPRVTSVGRVLRRWSLDELPQLWNVLKGDMSLVGPRPPLPEEVEAYREWHFDRLEVRPGITGLWQVSGRSNLSFDDYVRLDLFYVENWSPILDLYLLLRTVPAVLRRTGAY